MLRYPCFERPDQLSSYRRGVRSPRGSQGHAPEPREAALKLALGLAHAAPRLLPALCLAEHSSPAAKARRRQHSTLHLLSGS